ncbi:SDR family oxidoreductase [Candidatus Galacturonibacter soehngenii]|uniref:SDR family oxidoreductase n=1 Tax=Candidatus Galacturonatibacter soehngenii TaxID=2307010 RepID=A0A7V7QL48_9FIRM|nr:SDR family oxidoreductase [Candidatus Galacturonibacter soehngenii]KAB1438672.1 SDR family oxidoreductase [Candidatus Galacturonibacter soehngenii]MBA4685712.1 SDR family oxidoreductase [Candidatus Galacturonibacter soehngenii]
MKNICVITGGGSGMGLATAKVMGQDHYIIISGRTVEKLKKAIDELTELGIDAEAFACDVSDKKSVEKLAKHASKLGCIKSVIHAAGMSPNMADAEAIMKVNALGTIHVNDVFFQYMENGSCLIDVSSMSGYMIPEIIMPNKHYKLSRISHRQFMKKMMQRVNLLPKKHRTGVSYGISKNFVIWYAKTDAKKFAQKGIRIVSVSPGLFETPMGEMEKEISKDFIEKCAIKRYGKVEEIAYLFRYIADKKLSYLTGVDILCDGGCVASQLS